MVGKLAVSFCERRTGAPSVYLDLWAYPDGTYNLVMENFCGDIQQEYSFPCAMHQLVGLLERKPLESESDAGVLLVERCGNSVCAEFDPKDGRPSFRHCIAIEDYRMAIEALESHTVGYLA